MKCPFCQKDNDKVIDSRITEDGEAIRRRRECNSCGRRFTTYERVEEPPLRVIKKDGARVPFDRAKIITGILKACEKRPVAMEVIEKVVDEITTKIKDSFDKEVESRVIGEMVMEKLRDIDKIAYVRFASVYRDFKDVNEFIEEIRGILKKGG